MTVLATALDYAARGFAVFPCLEKRKEPACGRGFKEATTNPATIRRWWSGFHSYNIGIATGLISGVWVLDVDGADGEAALLQLEHRHGQLPPTLSSITSRGRHLWFRADGPIPSSVARVGRGLDVRGDGGYVLAPPSIHPDGPTYRWSTGTFVTVLAPAWLLDLAQKKPGAPQIPQQIQRSRSATHGGGYGQAALEREIEELAKTPAGGRNHQLNRASFSLHQLVAGGELDRGEVEHRLIQACEANGLLAEDGLRQCLASIRSGARAGFQNPRSRPERRS